MFESSPKTVIKFLSNKSNFLEDLSIIFENAQSGLLLRLYLDNMNINFIHETIIIYGFKWLTHSFF